MKGRSLRVSRRERNAFLNLKRGETLVGNRIQVFRTIQSHEIYLLFLNIYVYNACVYHIYVFVYSIKHVSLLYLFFHTYIYICCPDKTARKHIYSIIPLLSIIFQLVLSPIISLSFSVLPSISFNLHSLPPFSPCNHCNMEDNRSLQKAPTYDC